MSCETNVKSGPTPIEREDSEVPVESGDLRSCHTLDNPRHEILPLNDLDESKVFHTPWVTFEGGNP